MYQTRTCSPSGCNIQGQCVSSGTCVTTTTAASTTTTAAPTTTTTACYCDPWISHGCGTNGCAATQVYQDRGCSPAGCDSQSRCLSSASCTPTTTTSSTTTTAVPTTTTTNPNCQWRDDGCGSYNCGSNMGQGYYCNGVLSNTRCGSSCAATTTSSTTTTTLQKCSEKGGFCMDNPTECSAECSLQGKSYSVTAASDCDICCKCTTTRPVTTPTVATCGNSKTESGESCDPPKSNSAQCQQLQGECDYTKRVRCTRSDVYGSCGADCKCSWDATVCGDQDDAKYCASCFHCGDGSCNCGETAASCAADCSIANTKCPGSCVGYPSECKATYAGGYCSATSSECEVCCCLKPSCSDSCKSGGYTSGACRTNAESTCSQSETDIGQSDCVATETCCCSSTAKPTPSVPTTYGLNTHLYVSSGSNLDLNAFEKNVDDISEKGLTWVRFSLNNWEIAPAGSVAGASWDGTAAAQYREALSYAKSKELKVFLVTNVPSWAASYSQADYKTVTEKYYSYLADEYGSYVDVWQVFNEPNIHNYKDYSSVTITDDYLKGLNDTLETAAKTIKAHDPDAIVTTSVGGYPYDSARHAQWKQFFDAVGDKLDVLTVDVYPDKDPTVLGALEGRIKELRDRYKKLVYVGETGMCTGDGRFDEAAQGEYVAKYVSELKKAGPAAVLVYEMQDDTSKSGCEATFGIKSPDGTVKKSYEAVMTGLGWAPSQDKTPPAISKIEALPANPKTTDEVTINVEATDKSSKIKTCKLAAPAVGEISSTAKLAYGKYAVYADTGATDSWANVKIISSDKPDEAQVIKKGESKTFGSGLVVSLLSVEADAASGAVSSAVVAVASKDGTYSDMQTADGAYDSKTETASFAIGKAKYGGTYTAFVKCEDSAGNLAGPEAYSFEVKQAELPKNVKDASKYTAKTVFLISDKDWRSVLSLVPVAVWTNEDGSVSKQPLLIYHEEKSAFDADSIVYFMQQYAPIDRTYIVGDTPKELDNLLIAKPEFGAGMEEGNIRRMYQEQYSSFWKSTGTAVLVDYNNYEAGLLASTFASYINAPIFFVNGNNVDDYIDFIEDGKVYIVGGLDSDASQYITRLAREVKSFSISELQAEYVKMTGTTKMILTNPNDLNIWNSENFQPERSSFSISQLYGKTSLAAPILASAKHEVIYSIGLEQTTTDTNCENFASLIDKIDKTDSFVKDKVGSFPTTPQSLTIISTPNAIPQSFNEVCNPYDFWFMLKQSTDNFYAASDNHFTESLESSVDVDSNGVAHIAWAVRINKRGALLYQTYDTKSEEWGKPTNVCEDCSYVYSPAIKVDSNGNVHMSFRGRRSNGDKIKLMYIKLGTDKEVLAETVIAGEYDPIDRPEMALDNNGNVFLAWKAYKPDVKKYVNYFSKIEDGKVVFVKDLYEIGSSLIEIRPKMVATNDGINVLWQGLYTPDAADSKSNSLTLELAKFDHNGNSIGSSTLYYGDYSDLAVTSDSNGGLTALIKLYNDPEGENTFNIYVNGAWKKIQIQSTIYEISDISMDSEENIHVFGNGVKTVEGMGLPAPYYMALKLDGTVIVPEEDIINDINEYKIYNPFLSSFGSINGQDKYYLLFGTLEFEGSTPLLTIRGVDGWSVPQKIKSSETEKDFEMMVGRIYGLTLSDTSSYISRVLYDDQIRYKKSTGLSIGTSIEQSRDSASKVRDKMVSINKDWICLTDQKTGACTTLPETSYTVGKSVFENKHIITYDDHGSPSDWPEVLNYADIPQLSQTFSIADACSTNDFERGRGTTLGAWFIRKGATGYIGASGVSWFSYKLENSNVVKYANVVTDMISASPVPLGKIAQKLGNEFDIFKADYLLYGDPTFEVGLE